MYHKRETINALCFILICAILQVIVFAIIVFYKADSTLILDQVVILSRHNVRTPLSKNLGRMTPLPWPHWIERPGYLTAKGFQLEGYMGKFFFEWLYSEGILPDGCPMNEQFYVYADSSQRTMLSAQAFIDNAFPLCNITVNHNSNPDPIFSPFIHNSTADFRNIALNEMKNVLDSLQLNVSYKSIENILNYNNSEFCTVDKKCNMATDKTTLSVTAGTKPKLNGPLKICNEAVDEFLMAYYNGLAMEDVAWGKLNESHKWQSILDLTVGYHNVLFNTTHIAKDVAMPLLKYMTNIFNNKISKVTLLMGHDANIHVLLNAMSFKPYQLPDSFISTPIGGKIVFQKWLDIKSNKYYLKINYVYQSNEQLRAGQVLSLKSPPKFVLLQLNDCKIDNNGFCLWDDFIRFLNGLS